MRLFTLGCLVVISALAAFVSPAMADSRFPKYKIIVNHTIYPLTVILSVRAGADPEHQAGTVEYQFLPGETRTVAFGNLTNIYLNGVRAFTTHDGERIATDDIVTRRGSYIDVILNTYPGIEIWAKPTSLEVFPHLGRRG